MGQQQLLLIVLGVIVVGIAVVVGINLFTANAVSTNRDSVTSDLTTIGTMAQQYYRKPTAMGGGGSSFTGWTIPTHTDTTPNGIYTATISNQTITIVGVGTEMSGSTPIQHTATISPDVISIVKDN